MVATRTPSVGGHPASSVLDLRVPLEGFVVSAAPSAALDVGLATRNRLAVAALWNTAISLKKMTESIFFLLLSL